MLWGCEYARHSQGNHGVVWSDLVVGWNVHLDAAIPDAAAHSAPELDENDVAVFFVMMRFVIAGLMLLIFVPKTWRDSMIERYGRGLILGVIVWGGFILQMLGLTDVTPAVSAFLTSLYVVFTALIGVALGMQKMTRFAILGVLLATFGAGWISGPPQLNFGLGEWLTVGCAFLFGAHHCHRSSDKSGRPDSSNCDHVDYSSTLSVAVYLASQESSLVNLLPC